jgi:hypothetical protein
VTSETKPIGNYLVAYRTDKKTYVDFIDQEGDILRLTYEKTPEGILLEGIPKDTMMD